MACLCVYVMCVCDAQLVNMIFEEEKLYQFSYLVGGYPILREKNPTIFGGGQKFNRGQTQYLKMVGVGAVHT